MLDYSEISDFNIKNLWCWFLQKLNNCIISIIKFAAWTLYYRQYTVNSVKISDFGTRKDYCTSRFVTLDWTPFALETHCTLQPSTRRRSARTARDFPPAFQHSTPLSIASCPVAHDCTHVTDCIALFTHVTEVQLRLPLQDTCADHWSLSVARKFAFLIRAGVDVWHRWTLSGWWVLLLLVALSVAFSVVYLGVPKQRLSWNQLPCVLSGNFSLLFFVTVV